MPARCGRPAPPRLVRLTLAASHLQFFWGVTPRLSRNESSPVPVANSREARFPPKESTSSDPRSEANDPHMDYVCIGARNLIFKFGRWRRENYEVRVSPSFARTDSYEIVDALGFTRSKRHFIGTIFKISSSGLPSFVSRQDYGCVPSGEALFRL